VEALRAEDPGRVGRFRLLARLGAGGMGVVYLGRSSDGGYAAVKVTHEGFTGDAQFRTRFAREIAAASMVQASGIARVLDADPQAPRPWLATEYLRGPTLGEAVQFGGPLPPATVTVFAQRLADALAALHAARLVHRDLKPSNVLLTAEGPYLIDFGIAHAVDATAITTTGVVVGSPGFMSPEQGQGEAVGASSDVFSFAGVLVLAATGRSPFGVSSSPIVMLRRILDEEPDLSAVDDQLAAVLRPCLAKDPYARPTAAELAARFAEQAHGAAASVWPPAAVAAHQSEYGTAMPAPPTRIGGRLFPSGVTAHRWRRPALVGGAVALVVVVVLVLGFTLPGSPLSGTTAPDETADTNLSGATTSTSDPAVNLTGADVLAAMLAQSRRDGSGTFSVTPGARYTNLRESVGAFAYRDDTVSVHTTHAEQDFHITGTAVVNGRRWLKIKYPEPEGHWEECFNVDDPDCQYTAYAQDVADPIQLLSRAGSAVQLVTSKLDQVDGVPAVRYDFELHRDQAVNNEVDPSWRERFENTWLQVGTIHLWVDSEFRLRRMVIGRLDTSHDAVVYDSWGVPQAVAPPPVN